MDHSLLYVSVFLLFVVAEIASGYHHEGVPPRCPYVFCPEYCRYGFSYRYDRRGCLHCGCYNRRDDRPEYSRSCPPIRRDVPCPRIASVFDCYSAQDCRIGYKCCPITCGGSRCLPRDAY